MGLSVGGGNFLIWGSQILNLTPVPNKYVKSRPQPGWKGYDTSQGVSLPLPVSDPQIFQFLAPPRAPSENLFIPPPPPSCL